MKNLEEIDFFERKISEQEKIAWANTIFNSSYEDLLRLWYGVPFDHPIMKVDSLTRMVIEKINNNGGFKAILPPAREDI